MNWIKRALDVWRMRKLFAKAAKDARRGLETEATRRVRFILDANRRALEDARRKIEER